jgi:methionine-R-sulfoxide reductase
MIPVFMLICVFTACTKDISMEKKPYNKLTTEEERVLLHKGTEAPFSGKYNDFYEAGAYHCKQCDAALYRSADKFDSSCGWPSFDDEIEGSIRRQIDADGRRTEMLCANCDAHLGHIFEGEGLTDKNLRHCVNSVCLKFVPSKK